MAKAAWTGPALFVSLAALASMALQDRLAPFPAADVSRGSEDAFASGLQLREMSGPRRTPERWTRERLLVRFTNLPPGPRVLEVALHNQRDAVAVAVDGLVVGSLAADERQKEFTLPTSARANAHVELRLPTFATAAGRRLGAHLDRVALRHERGGFPAPGLLAVGLALGLGVLAAAAFAGVSPFGAMTSALLSLVCCGGLLWPMGLLRSPYSFQLPALILVGAALASLFARWRAARAGAEAGPWAFAAVFCAWLVQAVAMTSPMVVMSDAVLNVNKLNQVAAGDWFPVSRTQHRPPFEFPYSAAFYVLLLPLLRAGFDAFALVRYGAGIAGALSAGALFAIGESTPRRAAIAVAMLQLFPITCDLYSYGNLPNIFGQAVSLAFFAWWLRPRGGPALGALLLIVASLAHLSCTIVLAVLVLLLFASGGAKPPEGRTRVLAAGIAAVVIGAYYAHYVPLMLGQLGRLGEGGGQAGATRSLLSLALAQLQEAASRWGWPVVLLAAFGLPRPGGDAKARGLVAVWATGALLGLVALVSPVAVRYLFGMAFAVALAAAEGLERSVRAGRLGVLGATALVVWQATLALHGIVEIVLTRYRL